MSKIFHFNNANNETQSPSMMRAKRKKVAANNNDNTSETIIIPHAILEESSTSKEEVRDDSELKQERKYRFKPTNDLMELTTLRIAFLMGFICALIFAVGLLIWRFITSVSSFFSALHQPTNIKFNLLMSLFMALLCFIGLFAPRRVHSFVIR